MPKNIRPPGGRGSAAQMRSEDVRDFRGGLNLSDDLFNVGSTETPDMLNMDVHARGGLVLRGGMRSRSEARSGALLLSSMSRFKTNAGTEARVLIDVLDDGTPQATVDIVNGVEIGSLVLEEFVVGDEGLDCVQMNDKVFLLSKRYSRHYGDWTGNALRWETYEWAGFATWGTEGHVPRATKGAVWDNRMWVADTNEDGGNHRNRVRWSADGNPLVWGEDDWIDIDVGEDGDCITAIEVHGEVLVIFKQRAVYALVPDDLTLYARVEISRSVGTVGQHSVVSTPYGVMFWDERAGLHAWNEGQPTPIFDKIIEAIHEERIPAGSDVKLSWVNSRVWCTVDLDGVRSTLVFDPRVGAWTLYRPSVELVHRVDAEWWGWSANESRWLAVDLRDRLDDLGDGTQSIPSHWVSPWIHGGSHILEKRWRRPRFTVASSAGGQLEVDIRADLDPRSSVRSFNVELPSRVAAGVWGSPSVWGDLEFGGLLTEYAELVRGPSIGGFNSVQVRIEGPSTPTRWRLDALTATYIPKVLRA